MDRQLDVKICKINDGKCGTYKRFKKDGIYSIKDLNVDVTDHLLKLKVSAFLEIIYLIYSNILNLISLEFL